MVSGTSGRTGMSALWPAAGPFRTDRDNAWDRSMVGQIAAGRGTNPESVGQYRVQVESLIYLYRWLHIQ